MRSPWLVTFVGCGLFFLLAERPAKAQFAYAYGSDAIPVHFSWRTNTPPGVSSTETVRSSPFGADSLAFGLGLGYNGLNGQIDLHNAAGLWTGAATIGLRESLRLGPLELWGRIGVGVGVVRDTEQWTTTGAIATDAEAGLDWIFLSHIGLGVKAAATPQYSLLRTVSADFGLAIELRLII